MKPKVLYVDIETFPNLVYVWRLWQADAAGVVDTATLASFSYEWEGGEHDTIILPDVGGKEERLLEELWLLLDEADVVIAHNGKAFDIKTINARLIAHDFMPPSPYAVVDTLREVKKIAKFERNNLDFLSQTLSLGSKLPHEGFKMWQGCLKGEKKWWDKMRKYNRHDVILLKKLYKELSPWMTSGPNMNTFMGGHQCPNVDCGSKNLQARGLARTRTRTYQRYQCQDCGRWSQAARSEATGVAEVK